MAESSGLSLGTEPRHFLGSKRGGGGGSMIRARLFKSRLTLIPG